MASSAFTPVGPRLHQPVLSFIVILAVAATASGQAPDAVRPRAAPAAPCGVGYLPEQFRGKPDPWPNDVPLPNEQLLQAYMQRYGQAPGSGGSRIGYCCELFGLNYEALENAAKNGGTGPGGEVLHPGCVSTTEATDASFTIGRGSPYIGLWVVARREGGSPEHPAVVHEATRPCGAYSIPRSFFDAFTGYFDNRPPCGGGAGSLCGNGRIDPGETCATCPQDAGPCSTCGNGRQDPGETCASCPQDLGPCPVCQPPKVCVAPCPQLAAVPQSAKAACTAMLAWYAPGTGRYKKIRDACEVIRRAEAYKPSTQ
jgi:hypothetical protein